MNTNQNPPAVPSISEADVLAFCKAKAAEIAPQFPTLKDMSVTTTHSGAFWVDGWSTFETENVWGRGATIAEAVKDLRTKVETPESRAAKLRAEAEKLLAKAAALAPAPAQTETSNA